MECADIELTADFFSKTFSIESPVFAMGRIVKCFAKFGCIEGHGNRTLKVVAALSFVKGECFTVREGLSAPAKR